MRQYAFQHKTNKDDVKQIIANTEERALEILADRFDASEYNVMTDEEYWKYLGSHYVKGKVHYDYIDGEYTKDGIPFIVCVGISYDGKGNSDLPKDSIIMPFKDLPKMFPNNQFS